MARTNIYRLYPRTKDCEIKDMVFDPTVRTNRGLSKALARLPRKYKKRSTLKVSHFTIKPVKGETHKQECSSKISPQCLDIFVTDKEETICLRCKICG